MAGTTLFQDKASFFGGGMKTSKGVGFQIGSLKSATLAAAGANSATGLLIQQVSTNTKRPISTIFDLSDRAVYYVAGREQATLQMQRILGPAGNVLKFYAELGDICKAPTCSFDFAANTCLGDTAVEDNNKTSKLLMFAEGCVLTDVTIASSVQDYVCTESGAIQATALTFQD